MIILNGSNYSVLAGLNQQNEHMNEQCSYKNLQIEHTILITFFILHLLICMFIIMSCIQVQFFADMIQLIKNLESIWYI